MRPLSSTAAALPDTAPDTHTWGWGSQLPALSQPHAHGCDKWHGHRKGFTALLSFLSPTAFWGESDDSSSELEAALRPQTHGTDSDDFDDFYD